ncbi:MAG: ADP-ribosylation factor-like protein [Promethearchaeota archaeon]
MSKELQKIILCGLDNGGKTSILLLLNKKFSLLTSIKPTFKAKITSQSISLLGLKVANWDLGGQKNYREIYLKNKEKYFTDVQAIFFVIDAQCPERFEEAIKYLSEIVNIVRELSNKNLQFLILFHKIDPDIKNDKKIIENVNNLENKIKEINSNVNFSFYRTSIHDESSLLKAFSEGVILVSHKAQLIQNLLKEYTTKSFNSAAVLLDRHCFIIASRATKIQYERMCQEIAPRLTQAMEKLEEWDFDAKDIVSNIEFPKQDSEGTREGIIFLRKLDINKERLYVIALCLNKKIKVKSYEYLPILATQLKNLLESFE